MLLAGLAQAADIAYTPIHEAGRCAFRDQCGSKSFFGKQLPCVDNGKAEEPDQSLRDQLVELCGPKWKEGPVCCRNNQVCFMLLLTLMLLFLRSLRITMVVG